MRFARRRGEGNDMEFKTSNEKIWLENENGATIAFVDFPEFEPGKVEVTHTVVDPSLRGQGVAGKLMEALAKKLAADGRKATLTCSYAVRWFAKHPELEYLLIDPEEEKKRAAELAGDACGIPRHRK